MSLKYTAFALAAGLMATASAQAQVAITADLGTTGPGFHVVLPMESNLNGRFGANYFKDEFTEKSGAVTYHLTGKLQTFDVLFDWYLSEYSEFRVTAGMVYNDTKFTARASGDGTGKFTLNGMTYKEADVGKLTGSIDFRKGAPYLGIGWGNALASGSRWRLSADAGMFYQGKAKVHLVSIGCTTSNLVCGALAKDVAAERAKLEKDVDDMKIYPVLRATLSYRF